MPMTSVPSPDPQQLSTTTPQTVQAVENAIISRRSVRAFLPKPVDLELVQHLLDVAARAPSGTNIQPWKVWVLTGAAKETLSQKILQVYHNPEERAQHQRAYRYYPEEWFSPYIDRRRKIGWDMYGLLGIDKSNTVAMHEQQGQNYQFFGAPVGLMFTIHQAMQQGSWMDYGMFLQTFMIAARAHGLDTCAQAAFNEFHRIILPHIGAGPEQMLVCGMALGYADNQHPISQLRTEREPASQFAQFLSE
jgi:nitroreductase